VGPSQFSAHPLSDITKLLVIQEASNSCREGTSGVDYNWPNDDGGGGDIIITFSQPIAVQGRLYVVDQDEKVDAAKLYINNNFVQNVGGAADSQVSVFVVGDGSPIQGVTSIKFDLHGSGGIEPVDICVPEVSTPNGPARLCSGGNTGSAPTVTRAPTPSPISSCSAANFQNECTTTSGCKSKYGSSSAYDCNNGAGGVCYCTGGVVCGCK